MTGAGAVSLNEKAPSASWAKPWLVERITLIVITRLLIWDRTGPFVLDREQTVNLQLASINNPVNGIAVVAALQIRH